MVRNRVSPARWSAFEILRRVADGGNSSVLLGNEEPKLELADRALCHELVLGVLRRQLNLDYVIEHYAERKIERLDRSVTIALRLGLYQLRFLTRIPASAAVDESVKLVHAAKLSSARSFVNAVLRRATREPDFDPVAGETDLISKIAIETSHPCWLVERWINHFGVEHTIAFAQANNETPPIGFRIVRNRSKEKDVLGLLESKGLAFERSPIAQDGWRAAESSALLRELADKGEIYVQDEASQLVAELVNANSSERILDLCSAPGGKSTLIADRVDCLVVASDISARRLASVQRTVLTQQLDNVSLVLLDAAQSLPFQAGSFDRVLVDAPCSGTGTLRHNPEIRWRISEQDIRRLAEQQTRLLSSASKVLKAGGRLIYSTCSVEREENEEVTARFLSDHEDFRQIPLRTGGTLPEESGGLRTWPHLNRTDGFFVAAFVKR